MCLSSLGSDHMVFCAVRRMLRLHTFLHLLFAVWWRILPVSRGGIVETNIKAKCSQTKRKKKLKNTPQLVEHRQLRGIISITAGILSLPKTVDGNEKNTLSYMNIDSFFRGILCLPFLQWSVVEWRYFGLHECLLRNLTFITGSSPIWCDYWAGNKVVITPH